MTRALVHGGGGVYGGVEQRANDGLLDCPRHIVAHGAAMIDCIQHAHGNFRLGGFRWIGHSFHHSEDFCQAFFKRQLAADVPVHRCNYGPTISAIIVQCWLS